MQVLATTVFVGIAMLNPDLTAWQIKHEGFLISLVILNIAA